jgi:LuxR family transcriptional regulator, maltose regulon positive regulatory protein
MPGREAARQAAGERLRCAQRGPAGLGSGVEAAKPHRRSGEPIPSERSRSRGGLEVVPGGYGAARGRSRRPEHNPQQTAAALAPVRDGSVPRACLLWAAAALLLELIADDASDEPDRIVFPALIRDALGLLERRAGPAAAEAALLAELASLLGDAGGPASPSAEPLGPGEPLTQSETRVLRYLPTHMGATEIAAELFVSANTVKTHLRHLYRKLGAHSRPEAVRRARAIGLLTTSSRWT